MSVEEPEQPWYRQVFGESRPGRAGWFAIPGRRTRSASAATAVVGGGASPVARMRTAATTVATTAAAPVCVNLGRPERGEEAQREDECIAQPPYCGEHPCSFRKAKIGGSDREFASLCTTGMLGWFVPIEKIDRVSTAPGDKTGKDNYMPEAQAWFNPG
jgi:hypothetical protein